MKIYYTETNCYIKPISNITCMIITVQGGGIISDTTPQEYSLTHRGKDIIIFAHERRTAGLEDLFSFKGSFIIKRCKIIFTNSPPRNIGVKSKIKDNSSAKLNLTPESMTLNTEEYSNYGMMEMLKSTSGLVSLKISLQTKTRDNIMTTKPLWTKGNKSYIGAIHYHLDGKHKGKFMTGAVHTNNSEVLYREPFRKILKPAITNPTIKRFMKDIKI